MIATRTLYRCHKQTAKEHAEKSAEVIKGYFGLQNKRVKILVEPMEEIEGWTPEHLPYDVKIITASDEAVIETIKANEYTFTESGRMEN